MKHDVDIQRLLPLAFGAALGLAACGGSETANQLEVSMHDEDVESRAEWTYRSFSVDVDLTLTTVEGPDACTSSGTLVVNDAVSTTDTYRLKRTDCSILRLTDAGDIVLQGHATGHDWTGEALRVDTDRELVLLGPIATDDPETGSPAAFLFTLAAPPCADNPDCDCGALRRQGGPSELSLDLGRTCD